MYQTRYVLLNFNPLSGLETRCRKTQIYTCMSDMHINVGQNEAVLTVQLSFSVEEEAHEEVEAQKAKDEGKVGYHVVCSWYPDIKITCIF